jgi:hypothetical protein
MEEANEQLVRYLILRMTLVSGSTHSAGNCASSANREISKISLEASCDRTYRQHIINENEQNLNLTLLIRDFILLSQNCVHIQLYIKI